METGFGLLRKPLFEEKTVLFPHLKTLKESEDQETGRPGNQESGRPGDQGIRRLGDQESHKIGGLNC